MGRSGSESTFSRRALLRAAAGGAGVVYASGLPAWARAFPSSAHHLRRPDSRPFGHLPAGTASMPEIKHIVVLMMENHSFDNMLGMVPHQVRGRASVDGLTFRRGRVRNFNPGPDGPVHAEHASSPCQPPRQPSQTWNASHESYAHGRNDGFVRASGPIAMRFWDKRDLPFTYSLAKHFPIGNRYFCSVLAQTYPNRRFLFTGTASGLLTTNLFETERIRPANGSIWDRLDAHHISYAVYYQDLPSWAIVPGAAAGRGNREHKFDQFYGDVAAGRLPAFTFLDPNYSTTSEENPQDVQVGEDFLARVVHALMHAPTWRHTALFITYDEHGGYYDHVPPPRAIKPDKIPPMLAPGDVHDGYDRYGFRVPLIVVSPWARQDYVSMVVQDHTSITAFIEHKWNLPAMTFRDANAQPMADYFDFTRAAFAEPPRLTHGPGLGRGLAECRADGENPPLPTTKNDGAADAGR